jgi:hypothetical protein
MLTLKNIIKLESIAVSLLGDVQFLNDKVVVLPSLKWTRHNVKIPVSVEVSDVIESRNRIFTTKMTFQTCEDIDVDTIPLAFRVTSALGESFMIGSHDRPYPVINKTDPYPSNMGDSTLITYTVTYKNTIPMARVII